MRVVLGGGYRSEDFERTGSRGLIGSREISYGFAEARVPLIANNPERPFMQALDLNLSGRYESYSDVGDTATPKVGLRADVVRDVVLRGTWGKSFKAPSFYQLLYGQTVILYPASIVGGPASGTVFYVTGGNPELRPERSESWTFGVEYRPHWMQSMQLSATYFSVDYIDRVVMPMSAPTTAWTNPDYQQFVVRNPSAAAQATLIDQAARFINASGGDYNPSEVAAIVGNVDTNASAQFVDGVDLSYRQDFDIGQDRLNVFANATWTSLSQKTLRSTPERTLSGNLGQIPDYRVRGGATWRHKNFSTTAVVNHTSSETDPGVSPSRHVASWTTTDLNIEYAVQRGWLSGANVSVAVQNLFDLAPPYAESPGIVLQGLYFDSANASFLGRTVALTVRKRF